MDRVRYVVGLIGDAVLDHNMAVITRAAPPITTHAKSPLPIFNAVEARVSDTTEPLPAVFVPGAPVCFVGLVFVALVAMVVEVGIHVAPGTLTVTPPP